MTLGRTVAQLRKERRLTQAQLADALGWERGTIATVEAGHDRPGRELVEALAVFFKVTTDKLLGVQGEAQAAAAQSEDEAELLVRYRRADTAGKVALITTARAVTTAQQ
jgi:transcriptional regulator with XRE-family HTH domain